MKIKILLALALATAVSCAPQADPNGDKKTDCGQHAMSLPNIPTFRTTMTSGQALPALLAVSINDGQILDQECMRPPQPVGLTAQPKTMDVTVVVPFIGGSDLSAAYFASGKPVRQDIKLVLYGHETCADPYVTLASQSSQIEWEAATSECRTTYTGKPAAP